MIICLAGAWLGGQPLIKISTDWTAWRTCRVCHAGTGQPCIALSGRVAGGRPDGAATPLPRPHACRRKRVRRR